MSTNFEQWTKEEFLVYLMLYAANTDGNITEKEQKIIRSKVNLATYQEVLEQFETHGEYDCIQNILKYKEKYLDNEDAVKQIVSEMTEVFMGDGKISNAEQHILNLVAKILK